MEYVGAKTSPLARLLGAPYFLWISLALPGVYLSWQYWQGAIFYGEYLHATGEFAARLLIVTMAVTPLGLMFPNAAWVRWLAPRRRYLGAATFGYALLHAVAYIQRQPVESILGEALEIGMWTGWLALAVMMALAVTSNEAAARFLRRGCTAPPTRPQC
ncbi:MAG: hypothetical protein RQ899_12095 [Pseudomonadales bacterium]|nr:hypothetical protein [Pseudomonadales bacterium]